MRWVMVLTLACRQFRNDFAVLVVDGLYEPIVPIHLKSGFEYKTPQASQYGE
jgi:hypothetical protein